MGISVGVPGAARKRALRAPHRLLWTGTGLCLLALGACSGGGSSTPAVQPTPPPVITSLTATPPAITVGESSQIAWGVTGASTLTLEPGMGAVSGNAIGVSPRTTTTYTLVATGGGGTRQASVTVTVNPAVAPAITAQPADQWVATGQTATFRVTTTGSPAPAFQWQQSTDGGSTWKDVVPATSGTASAFTTPPVAGTDHGTQFRVSCRNAAGTVVSGAATLRVLPAGGTALLQVPIGDTGTTLSLAKIPKGSFTMGTPGTTLLGEVPHPVTLTRDYYLGLTEITQAEWKAVMGASNNPSGYKGDNLPVHSVTWEQVAGPGGASFVARLNQATAGKRPEGMEFRLPTEAEWEWAARGGAPAYAPFGIGDGQSLSSTQANFDGRYPYGTGAVGPNLGRPVPVGSYPLANAFGLFDMHGNVGEFCQDYFWDYSTSPQTDPLGPPTGTSRVFRGGAFLWPAEVCRTSARRGLGVPGGTGTAIGFRVALGAPLVGELPVITGHPTGGTFAIGERLELRCTASGPGTLTYAWTKNGQEITGANTSTFTLSSLQRQDEGDYRCRVSNALGPVLSSAARVTVLAGTAAGVCIDQVHINQGIQLYQGSVPLIAGREGALRVFLRAPQPNAWRPQVRVTVLRGGTVLSTAMIQAPIQGVPVVVDESRFDQSWNLRLAGSLIQPGNSLVVELDPEGGIPADQKGSARWPATGAWEIPCRAVPTLPIAFVPMNINEGPPPLKTEELPIYLRDIQALWPLADIDAKVLPVYTPSIAKAHSWDELYPLISELEAKRVLEDRARYYVYVIPNSTGLTGGFAAGPSLASPYANRYLVSNYLNTLNHAHELGHSFGLPHAPCGGPAGADPNYPYSGALIGPGFGLDFGTWKLVSNLGMYDRMSYCYPSWISDYNFTRCYANRAQYPVTMPALSPGEGEGRGDAGLLVWACRQKGRWQLRPAFSVDAPPMDPVDPEEADLKIQLVGTRGEILGLHGVTLPSVALETGASKAEGFATLLPHPSTPVARIRLLEADGTVTCELGAALRPEAGLSASGQEESDGARHLGWKPRPGAGLLVLDAEGRTVLGMALDETTPLRLPERGQVLVSHGTGSRRATVEPDGSLRWVPHRTASIPPATGSR